MLSLADGDAEDGGENNIPDGEGRADLASQAVAVHVAELVGPEAAGEPGIIPWEPKVVAGYLIKYDGGSHSSGVVRAYVACSQHPRCYKYRQINQDRDERELHTFLVAWLLAGHKTTRSEHVDRFFWPDEAEFAEARSLLDQE